MKEVIVETKDRVVLNEGRNNGMAFAFLKKEGDVYNTVNPLSPCKDYLNEVVFTENTGFPTSACGLNYPQKNDIFKENAFLAIKILKSKEGQYFYSSDIETDKKYLQENYKNIESLFNSLEVSLNIKDRTIITEVNDDHFLVKAPLDWIKSTYSISLYTLLLRVALVYKGNCDFMTFLRKYNYNKQDMSLLSTALDKLKIFLEFKNLPEQETHSKEEISNRFWVPHNKGIISYKIENK